MKLEPPLDRAFRLIAFDWDGIASRAEDATLRRPLERLLRCGVLAIAITGTNVADLDRQLSRAIRGPHKRNLFLATDRGSEVYGFDATPSPVLVARRTDNSDPVLWILGELAVARGIRPDQILIAGDELGPVPAGVLHIGGGPARFPELLAAQAALHPVTLPARPEPDPAWIMVEDGFVVAREHEIESLFAIGNGFVGSRGSLAEGSPLSSPATFVAGVFESAATTVPELARAPQWSDVSGTIDGQPLRIDVGETLEHRRTLDLRQGILWRYWRQRDPSGRITRIEGLRLASQADRHLLLQSITLTPENYSGTFAGRLPPLASVRVASGVSIEVAAAGRIEEPEGSWSPPTTTDPDARPASWQLEVELGKTYRLDRLVCIDITRDPADSRSSDHVREAYERGIEHEIDAHRAAWRARWETCDVVVDGDPHVQRALRFAAYHLISAADPDDGHVSIGARALTGPAYKGHVFWDTELFMLPFFTLTYPEAARALLMYRHHTLPAARARAVALGCRGALYAWESAVTGEDVTPPFVIAPTGEVTRIYVGEQEQHISADIAFAVWSYWHATGDDHFLHTAGAEILVETARFWASRARREDDRRYHIRGVIGPDEYHESVDDNAYTNGMARWNLEVAAEIASVFAERWPDRWKQLAERLLLDPGEVAAWRRIGADLYTGFDERTGLFEQFQGYFGLEEIDLAAHEPSAPLDLHLGRDRIQRSKVIKQADVLMLLYLLGDRFPAEVREANFRYYEPRTSHGSSLSPAIHAAMAAQLGFEDLAMSYLNEAIEIDLADRMGNAAGGVHVGALGGLWQAVVFGFAGLDISSAEPRVRPRLPASWRALRFAIQWRGVRIPFELSCEGAPFAREARA